MRLLVLHSIVMSQSYGIQSDRNRAFIAALSFGFGHGACTDPLYPWIGAALGHTLVINPEDRAARLYDRVQVYIDLVNKAIA